MAKKCYDTGLTIVEVEEGEEDKVMVNGEKLSDLIQQGKAREIDCSMLEMMF